MRKSALGRVTLKRTARTDPWWLKAVCVTCVAAGRSIAVQTIRQTRMPMLAGSMKVRHNKKPVVGRVDDIGGIKLHDPRSWIS